MTSWDTFCFLTTLHAREAELEEIKKKEQLEAEAAMKAEQTANVGTIAGDSAKGAKLFQVSFARSAPHDGVYSGGTFLFTNMVTRLVALSATPSRLVVPTRSAPT